MGSLFWVCLVFFWGGGGQGCMFVCFSTISNAYICGRSMKDKLSLPDKTQVNKGFQSASDGAVQGCLVLVAVQCRTVGANDHVEDKTKGCMYLVSVSVSAQDGIVALGKAHTRSAPSLSSLPKVALETVPIFVWLNTDRSRPWRVECRPLPFSTPLSFRRSML